MSGWVDQTVIQPQGRGKEVVSRESEVQYFCSAPVPFRYGVRVNFEEFVLQLVGES